MAGGFSKPTNPMDEMAQVINDLLSRVRRLEQGTFRVPILNEDPPETDPINIWAFADGKVRIRYLNPAGTAFVYREVSSASSSSGSTSATAPAAPAAAPISRELGWGAQWTQSYRQSGAARTDAGEERLYYGSSGDGFNGRNRSLIGFDYSGIATELTGSTVTRVRLRITSMHTYYNSGSDAHFGIHNFTSEPGSWGGGGIPRSMIFKTTLKTTQTKTIELPLEFATAIRDGTGKGFAIESPSDSRTFYGYAAGVGSGIEPPVLIVNYDK